MRNHWPIRAIAAADRSVPVIAVLGQGQKPEARTGARAAGAKHIFETPLRIEQFDRAVAKAMIGPQGKQQWHGSVVGVQPRIRLTRSFDQSSHSYLGYVLRLRGSVGGEPRDFVVAVGSGAHEKHQFRVGDEIAGLGLPVEDPQMETADLYKVSDVKVISRGGEGRHGGPPFLKVPPSLEVYQERGARRLAARTYATRCSTCIWGCEMAVEMIIDQWNPSRPRYRRETFCYGPKSCPFYAAGPTRKVPGRKGMSWEEEDWVDEQATAHRGPDE